MNHQEYFTISLFLKVLIWVLRVIFLLQFLVHIFLFDPAGSVDPDPGNQNIADPTGLDPDPKHCLNA